MEFYLLSVYLKSRRKLKQKSDWKVYLNMPVGKERKVPRQTRGYVFLAERKRKLSER